MKQVITTERHLIKLWLDDLEEGALVQAKNLANLPFVFKHVAIMPDSHQGYGMPIGAVLATENVIIPNAVGVDIGCGMCAQQTSLTEVSQEDLKKILSIILETVPVGFDKHSTMQDDDLMPDHSLLDNPDSIVGGLYDAAKFQLGTLGGGNHFIEIQKGNDGHVWIMVHSGSRNLGKQVADHYNKRAVELNERWFSSVPKAHELAYLPIGTAEAQEYADEMAYCVRYAQANRRLMMERIQYAFEEVTDAQFYEFVETPHNYCALEHHFGANVYVHRKGATSAREGQLGIIPGSQGSKSYIVVGKGNADSFQSCSHGAGRKLGRKAAQRTLNLDEEVSKLDALGVLHAIRNVADLDEAPGAYKDISEVMKNQEDLVDIVVELSPLAVVKG